MYSFIKDRCEELNPWQNIKILHTNILPDILAGITVAIIALPLALAFGEISQLGPEAGIWSAIVGGIIGGLFGGCIVGVSGPTAPMASQIAAFMGAFLIGNTNEPDLVAAFSIIFLSGLFLVGISMLKISRLVHYIPYSVIAGFMCGIGVIIILSQINPFFGLEAAKSVHEFLNNFKETFQNINFQALYISVPSLIIVLLWSMLEKRIRFLFYIPSPLIVLIVGSSIAYFLNLDVSFIGEKMSNKSSSTFTFYLPDLSRIKEFIGPALALSGLAIIDSLLSCKISDNMTGIRHSSDRETFGQGMANMAAGILGGISTATATTQTVGNITFGAKTPLSTIIKGLTMLAILFGLGPFFTFIPNACLAAILIKLGFDILDYRILPVLKKLPRFDLLVFTFVLFITVYMNLMIAVFVGIILSLIYSYKEIQSMFRSNCNFDIVDFSRSIYFKESEISNNDEQLSINVIDLKGPLFFGTVHYFLNRFSKHSKYKMLILNMTYVTNLDLTGAYALEDLLKKLNSKGIEVAITNMSTSLIDVLERINFFKHYNNKLSKNPSFDDILEVYSLKK